ncbi:MAG: hypothetical protein Q7S52_05710 [bacterium]|nr:hypothetical protein [bacterium]
MDRYKYGIDWTKIALAVNDERRKAIEKGAKSSDAFNIAYRAVTCQYSEITGEAWKEGRSIVGTIMKEWQKEKGKATQTKTTAKNKQATPQKPAFDLRSKKDEVVSRGAKYTAHSFFIPGGTLVVELIPGTELHFRSAENKVKNCGARNTFDRTRKVEKHLLALGMKIAKARFAEKDKRQSELEL